MFSVYYANVHKSLSSLHNALQSRTNSTGPSMDIYAEHECSLSESPCMFTSDLQENVAVQFFLGPCWFSG